MAYVFAGAVLYFRCNRIVNGARFRFFLKGLTVGSAVFVVGCTGFYGMLLATGRAAGELDFAGVWHHTSFYIGGSVPFWIISWKTILLGD